jgi:hypothetical protein
MTRKDRRLVLAVTATTIITLALVIAIVYRPTPVLGIDGESLAHSVSGGGIFGSSGRPCTEVASSKTWKCVVDGSSGGTVIYEVEDPDWWGCWEARHIGGTSVGSAPSTLSRCVTLADHK